MTESESELARLRAEAAIQGLPPKLLADVISDGVILSAFGIRSSPRPISLGSAASSVDRAALLEAFASAAKGEPAVLNITQNAAPREASVTLSDDGSAWVSFDKERVGFPHAALWDQDATRRSQRLDAVLKTHTLNAECVARLHTLLDSPDYSLGEFVQATKILASVPEEFTRHLRDKLRTQSSFSEFDVLPHEALYWDQLALAPEDSRTLKEYLANELAMARREALVGAPVRYGLSMALQFSAPELVPHKLLASLNIDQLVQFVEAMSQCYDPYTLVSAFEICARQSTTDTRFATIGAAALDRLITSQDQLRRRCSLFGSLFILATVRLSSHTLTQGRPAFWRRLVAAAHASLVVRTLEDTDRAFTDEFAEITFQHRGEEYFLATYSDMPEAPRWNPEWIDVEWLMPDLLGRVESAAAAMAPAPVPPAWTAKLTSARQWIEEGRWHLRTMLPSVAQGDRGNSLPAPPEQLGALAEQIFAELLAQPTSDNLIRFGNMVEFAGAPTDSADAIGQAFQRVVDTGGMNEETLETVRKVTARLAAVTSNTVLAERLAAHLLQNAPPSLGGGQAFQILLLLLECYGAQPDVEQARTDLGRRVENLANLLSVGGAATRVDQALRSLQRLNPALAPSLGGAANVAKLAALPRTLA